MVFVALAHTRTLLYTSSLLLCFSHIKSGKQRERHEKSSPKSWGRNLLIPPPLQMSLQQHLTAFPAAPVWMFGFFRLSLPLSSLFVFFFTPLPTSLDGFAWDSKSRRKIQVTSPQWFNVNHLGSSGLRVIECQGNIENKVWGLFQLNLWCRQTFEYISISICTFLLKLWLGDKIVNCLFTGLQSYDLWLWDNLWTNWFGVISFSEQSSHKQSRE